MLDHQKFMEIAAKYEGDERRIIEALIHIDKTDPRPFESLITKIVNATGCDRKLVSRMFRKLRS